MGNGTDTEKLSQILSMCEIKSTHCRSIHRHLFKKRSIKFLSNTRTASKSQSPAFYCGSMPHSFSNKSLFKSFYFSQFLPYYKYFSFSHVAERSTTSVPESSNNFLPCGGYQGDCSVPNACPSN